MAAIATITRKVTITTWIIFIYNHNNKSTNKKNKGVNYCKKKKNSENPPKTLIH